MVLGEIIPGTPSEIKSDWCGRHHSRGFAGDSHPGTPQPTTTGADEQPSPADSAPRFYCSMPPDSDGGREARPPAEFRRRTPDGQPGAHPAGKPARADWRRPETIKATGSSRAPPRSASMKRAISGPRSTVWHNSGDARVARIEAVLRASPAIRSSRCLRARDLKECLALQLARSQSVRSRDASAARQPALGRCSQTLPRSFGLRRR